MNREISIRELKSRISKKFPNEDLTHILLSLPDVLSAEELIGATAILLAIVDTEKHLDLDVQKLMEGGQ